MPLIRILLWQANLLDQFSFLLKNIQEETNGNEQSEERLQLAWGKGIFQFKWMCIQ